MFQLEMNKEDLEDKGVDFNTTYFIGLSFKFEEQNLMINVPEGIREQDLLKVINKTIVMNSTEGIKKEISQVFFTRYWKSEKLMQLITVDVKTKNLKRVITPVWIEENMPILSKYTKTDNITSNELPKNAVFIYNTVLTLLDTYNTSKKQVASLF